MELLPQRRSRAAIALVALNVGVWLLQLANGVSPLHPTSPVLIAWGGNLPLFTLTGDTWRLLTSTFLHGGIVHLGLNMLALWMTADRTADEYGGPRMVAIYVAGGILASCASALWSERHLAQVGPAALEIVSVGASGAVMAQFGALLTALLVTPPRFVALPPDKRPSGVDLALVAVVAANVAFGFMVPHVDQAAHLGGLAAGIVVGALMAAVPGATGWRPAVVRYAATAGLVTAGVSALLHFTPQDRLVVARAVFAAQLSAVPATPAVVPKR